MIDLGDPVPLSVFVIDDTGAAANAGTVVLTVTLPDMTVITPAIVNGAVGIYSASYVPTLPGRHTVRWVATGANLCAYPDVFNVAPSDPGFIISLDDARKGLVLSSGQTAKDDDLRTYISAACPIMEDLVGPILRTARTETYDGGTSQINLLWSPLISVSSIVESFGSTYVRTLTAQDVFAGSGLDSFGYSADLTTGIITRRATGMAIPFALGKRNVQITYVSGRAMVGGNILLATRRLIAHLWRQDQTWSRPGVPNEEMTTTPSGFAVPRAVVEMVGGGDTRPQGLA